jgi:succinate-semialdehyde dehydrogenase
MSSLCSSPRTSTRVALDSFEATGKVWFTDDEAVVQKFREVVFPDGRLNKDVVGRSCKEIGAMAGIDIPASVRIILLPAKGAGTEDVLAKEKLCP